MKVTFNKSKTEIWIEGDDGSILTTKIEDIIAAHHMGGMSKVVAIADLFISLAEIASETIPSSHTKPPTSFRLLINQITNMRKHVKIYMEFFGYYVSETTECEHPGCRLNVVDVHHINKRGPGRDRIEWLIGCCRKHHNDYESGRVSKQEQIDIHKRFVERYPYTAYEPDWTMFKVLPPGTVLRGK